MHVRVCGSYEGAIQHPIKNAVAGDLVEMMLIQIQYIKKEVLQAMGAMDEILRQNRFNLQVRHAMPFL